MTRRTSLPADPPQVVRALVATADRRLAAWAREGLPAAGVTVCAEAEDAEGAVRLAREFRPDLGLLDVSLPGNAMTALHSIKDRAPATRVVMLANAADDPALLAALRGGASGCIIATPKGSALERTLGDVLAGHAALPRALLARLVADL
jgi:two-component system, NarL family, nitrate/nitrite response regulator NarL